MCLKCQRALSLRTSTSLNPHFYEIRQFGGLNDKMFVFRAFYNAAQSPLVSQIFIVTFLLINILNMQLMKMLPIVRNYLAVCKLRFGI